MKFEMKDGIERASKPRSHPGFEAKIAGAGVSAKQPNKNFSTACCKSLESKPNRYLSVRSVAQRFDISVNTVWRWVRNKMFPAPVKLSDKCTRWRESDLIDYEERTGVSASSISKRMQK